jgi:sugar lactone lactonase YvrE
MKNNSSFYIKLVTTAALCAAVVNASQAGTLYVSYASTGEVVRFAADGSVTSFASGLRIPENLAWDGSGNLYVAELDSRGTSSIAKITPTGVKTTFASGLGGAAGLAVDKSGNVFASDVWDLVIYKFSPEGSKSVFASGVYSIGLTFDSNGNLYAADTGFAENSFVGRIYRFTPDGSRTTFASDLGYPWCVAFDKAGNLFASDAQTASIWKFTPGGLKSTFASGLGGSVACIAFDEQENLFYTDQNGFISKLSSQGVPTLFASVPGKNPTGLIFAPVTVTALGFSGLYAPYAPPSERTFKIPSTVPLKWQYTNSSGQVISSASAAPSVKISPSSCGGSEGVQVMLTDAGTSGYQYDAATSSWQFNWQTAGLAPGCYSISISSAQTGQTNGPFPVQLR